MKRSLLLIRTDDTDKEARNVYRKGREGAPTSRVIAEIGTAKLTTDHTDEH